MLLNKGASIELTSNSIGCSIPHLFTYLHERRFVFKIGGRSMGSLAQWGSGGIALENFGNFICQTVHLGNISAIIGPQNGPILLC